MNLFKHGLSAAAGAVSEVKGSPSSRLRLVALSILVISLSLLLSLVLTHQNRFTVPLYQPGDIARADIIIPMDALIADEPATEARRAEARAKALPVYRYNPSLQEDQTRRLKTAFAKSRALLGMDATGKGASRGTRKLSFKTLPASVKAELRSTMKDLGVKPPVDDLLVFLLKDEYSPDLENSVILLLKDLFQTALIADDLSPARGKEHIHRMNLATGKTEDVPAGLLEPPVQILNELDGQIRRDNRFSAASRPHVRRLLEALIVPNATFDGALTKARQEEDVKNIDHVLRKLKKGKVVLRQGDEIGKDHLAQIEAIRKLVPPRSSWSQTIGMAALIATLSMILILFIRFLPVNQWSHSKLAVFLILTLVLNLLLLKASWFVCESVSQGLSDSPFNDKAYFFYLLPFACGSMLVTLLAGERCAQIFSLFFCILAGQSIGTDGHGYLYILMANLAGILFIRKTTQRIGMIAAGFKVGLSATVLFLILKVVEQAPLDWTNGSFGAFLAFLSGPVNAIFLVFTLPLCERLFMVTTEIRLSELGNLNLPLIRDLILKAPGTYNHSMAVGTLCEGAAKAIGLNPLFLRIASLYHDIGKTVQPEYFAENQRADNPHERISPVQSAQILEDHITRGVSLARTAKLPSSIADLIPQHHGTKLMRFFYDKALRETTESEKEVQEAPFRYFGPKPQTKAAAVLMLADGIEAAARTLNDHSQEKLLNLIRRIITDTMEDGQFSECDLTLSDIDRIAYSFLETLSSYYHGRIVYPGFDFNQPLRADAGKPPA